MKENHEREDIGCLKAIEMFYAYLDGELGDAGTVAEFEHHLEHCRSCFSRMEFEKLLTARLRVLAGQQAPLSLQARLRTLMERF